MTEGTDFSLFLSQRNLTMEGSATTDRATAVCWVTELPLHPGTNEHCVFICWKRYPAEFSCNKERILYAYGNAVHFQHHFYLCQLVYVLKYTLSIYPYQHTVCVSSFFSLSFEAMLLHFLLPRFCH